MNIDLQAKEIRPLRQTFDRVEAVVGNKPGSRYLEAVLGTQPVEHFHYRPTWEPSRELFDTRRSQIQMKNWDVLRDPRQFYYATWTMARARQQETVEANYQFVESRGLLGKMPEALHAEVAAALMPLRHLAWGGNMNNCSICSRGYGTAFTAPVLMHAMDHLGVAQYLTRLGLLLGGSPVLDGGKTAWLEDARWQGLRRFIEDSFVEQDPIRLFVYQNVALDGLLYPLIYGHYVDDRLAARGGTAISMLTAFMPEWHAETARWIDAVLKLMAAESDENRQCLEGWLNEAVTAVEAALKPVADSIFGEADAGTLMAQVREQLAARMKKAGLALAARATEAEEA